MIIRDVEKAKFDFINHSDAMSLRIIYNGQCAKPPDPLVEFINYNSVIRTPMFMLNLFQCGISFSKSTATAQPSFYPPYF